MGRKLQMTVDTNAYLSRWPFRRLTGDEPSAFVAHMRKQGITEAWVGSFDGLLHRDVGGVNARLAADCKNTGNGMLIPFGTVNPKSPDWQEDLRRCRELHRMPGIRLHPNYHGYSLADAEFSDVLRRAAGAGMIVQLAVQMEDERTQHPLMRVPPVNLGPLADIVRTMPSLRLVILNLGSVQGRKQIAAAGQVFFDFAMVEHVVGVTDLAAEVSRDRVVFGSHFPLYYVESAAMKVREAGFGKADVKAICVDNARRILPAHS
jgi:predicted TIM-barrel fold metal-dependent hydrolase